jgi:chromosome segregation ATPase
MSLHELAKPLYDATQAAQRLDEQLSEVEELLEDQEAASQSLTDELSAIQDELSEISVALEESRGNASVAGAIQQSSTLPTEDQLWQVDAAWGAAPPLVERLNELITDRVPDFNASLDAEGVRPDPGARLEVPRRPGRQQ